jgi:hypothetical protein
MRSYLRLLVLLVVELRTFVLEDLEGQELLGGNIIQGEGEALPQGELNVEGPGQELAGGSGLPLLFQVFLVCLRKGFLAQAPVDEEPEGWLFRPSVGPD